MDKRTETLKPCVFFDRDGIINHPPTLDRYVRNWEEFILIPSFLDALRVATNKGYEAVVVTNQKGVSTGRMTQADVDEIHDNLLAVLKENDMSLCDVVVCTAADDSHTHRKPNPGMLLEAAEKHGLDLGKSWMVGDHETDVVAGRRAGCKTVLVGGRGDSVADYCVADAKALVRFLEEHL